MAYKSHIHITNSKDVILYFNINFSVHTNIYTDIYTYIFLENCLYAFEKKTI